VLAPVRLAGLLRSVAGACRARPLAPSGALTSRSRRYRIDTLILETTFETVDGIVTVVDFMPPRQANSDVVRLVTGVSGRVTMECELAIRFDYGSQVPWISPLEDGSAGLSIVSGRPFVAQDRARPQCRRPVARQSG